MGLVAVGQAASHKWLLWPNCSLMADSAEGHLRRKLAAVELGCLGHAKRQQAETIRAILH